MKMKSILLLFCSIMLIAAIGCKTDTAPPREQVKTIAANQVTGELKLQTDKGQMVDIPGLNDTTTTIFFVVKNAKRDPNGGDNPSLSPEGKKRAEFLSNMMRNVKLGRVCMLNRKVAIETGELAMLSQGVASTTFTPQTIEPMLESELTENRGKAILMIANSATVPAILNFFTPQPVYKDIPEDEDNHLYVVSAKKKGDAKIMEFKY